MRAPCRQRRDEGQAAVSLVVTVPLLLLLVAAAAQLALVGHAAWSAAGAARAAARSVYVGGDPQRAARAALPGQLRDRTRVRVDGDLAKVRIRTPALVRGLPSIPVAAEAGLGPEMER